jgi:hypothetical protein
MDKFSLDLQEEKKNKDLEKLNNIVNDVYEMYNDPGLKTFVPMLNKIGKRIHNSINMSNQKKEKQILNDTSFIHLRDEVSFIPGHQSLEILLKNAAIYYSGDNKKNHNNDKERVEKIKDLHICEKILTTEISKMEKENDNLEMLQNKKKKLEEINKKIKELNEINDIQKDLHKTALSALKMLSKTELITDDNGDERKISSDSAKKLFNMIKNKISPKSVTKNYENKKSELKSNTYIPPLLQQNDKSSSTTTVYKKKEYIFEIKKTIIEECTIENNNNTNNEYVIPSLRNSVQSNKIIKNNTTAKIKFTEEYIPPHMRFNVENDFPEINTNQTDLKKPMGVWGKIPNTVKSGGTVIELPKKVEYEKEIYSQDDLYNDEEYYESESDNEENYKNTKRRERPVYYPSGYKEKGENEWLIVSNY